MIDTQSFHTAVAASGRSLLRGSVEVLQLNLGSLCNLTCTHCHVNAGPHRTEIMDSQTVDRILDWWRGSGIPTLDLTGGAPEMVPDFRRIVDAARRERPDCRIIDRCNLTILEEPGHEDLATFLADRRVEVIASMPCYAPENVNSQRGDGVFDQSIAGLQRLNELGYGRCDDLTLHLVYNPVGTRLPGNQGELERDYKRELKAAFDIDFHRLFTITNMPIARFASYLKRQSAFDDYVSQLVGAFNEQALDSLMCRNTLSVDWVGRVYDCDFNQTLGMRWTDSDTEGKAVFLWDLDFEAIPGRPIQSALHCFGCTAGEGSSCQGALV